MVPSRGSVYKYSKFGGEGQLIIGPLELSTAYCQVYHGLSSYEAGCART